MFVSFWPLWWKQHSTHVLVFARVEVLTSLIRIDHLHIARTKLM